MPQECPQQVIAETQLGDGNYGAFDARILTKYNDHWITSPNANFVPKPFLFEGKTIMLCHNSWFGHIDCFQWPQLYAEHYMNVPEDFALERGSAFRVGRVHPDKWKHLEIVYKRLEEQVKNWPPKNPDDEGPLWVHIWIRQCQRSLMHLKQLPFTFCDTVVLVMLFQHLCLDIYAMVDSLEIKITPPSGPFFNAKQHWMGAFTTDPDVCEQLFEARIPIWLVWKPELVPKDMKIHHKVDITCPEGIITTPDEFEVSQMLKWNARWYYPGDPMHVHTCEAPVVDLEQFAVPWPEPNPTVLTPTTSGSMASNTVSSSMPGSALGVVRTDRAKHHSSPYNSAGSKKAKTSTAPNIDLPQDFDDPAFPTHLYSWHAALTDVNKDPKRIHASVPKIAYFFPHPVLFMRGESSEWRQSFSGNQICEAADIFGLEFVKIQHDVPSHVQFRDITIGLADLATINSATKGKILWDLYEHNFHFELVALDCLLVPALWLNVESEWLDQVRQIFPGDSELTMFAEPFPVKDQGLASLEPQTKLEYVKRFQTLLASWPGFLPDLGTSLPSSASPVCVWAVEKWLVLFYVQSFFNNFGHLPIILHLIPKNPHSIYGLGNNCLIPSSSASSSTSLSALPPRPPQA
ncbi:hypothetical protein M404DRAFT_21322 [Pisolithus tinctorius Marx 270]|uniref:Uncharacterized protein n=1 Tax=Pisolithus tinctorius Marx 270 TaxID=870435 RepID=A0A0C3PNE8_PISTI|nr:hypothetical protein M404DRAFT_21322 [Pisolithus tinctorius Marx 270]